MLILLHDKYPLERHLDGVCCRVKRGGKFVPRSFSDLTDDEQKEYLNRLDEDALKRLSQLLAANLRAIGDRFDIVGMSK